MLDLMSALGLKLGAPAVLDQAGDLQEELSQLRG